MQKYCHTVPICEIKFACMVMLAPNSVILIVWINKIIEVIYAHVLCIYAR